MRSNVSEQVRLEMALSYERLKNLAARRLHQVRKQQGLTQRDVAKQLGVTQSQMAHYESGRTPIGIDQLVILRRVFDKPLAYFLLNSGYEDIGDLSPTIEQIVDILQGLDPEDRKRVLDFAEYVANLAGRNHEDST